MGKAKKARTWEAAYYYKELEADAVIDEICDSDFGADGGTNRRGHIGWVAYCPTGWMKAVVKYSDTKVINESIQDADDVGRLQFDLTTKFSR